MWTDTGYKRNEVVPNFLENGCWIVNATQEDQSFIVSRIGKQIEKAREDL